MSDQPRITFDEITSIQQSINDAINSQIKVCERIQTLRYEIQSDRQSFIEQWRAEVGKAWAKLRQETQTIHKRMLSEISIAATEILRDYTIKTIRGEALDQSESSEALDQSGSSEQMEATDQSKAINQHENDEENK